MNRPLVCLAVFYCLGIAIGSAARVNFWLLAAWGGLCYYPGILKFRDNRVFIPLVLSLAVFFGVLNLKNTFTLGACHISRVVPYGSKDIYSLSGVVDSHPSEGNGDTVFVFRIRQAQMEDRKWDCCGKILVKMDFPQDLGYAEFLTLTGRLYRPQSFSAAGRSYRAYLFRQGVHLLMRLESPLQVKRHGFKKGNGLAVFCDSLRSRMQGIIKGYADPLPAAILSAMVLGDKAAVPGLVNDYMVKSGTVHILVVSGFNVGIVAFISNLLFKVMRIRRKPRIVLAVICLLIYCLVTGASNPVIRATVMGTVFLLGYLVRRQADIYSCLASAALFILVINPRQLFDVGFQLSFASVTAIAFFYPRLKHFMRLDNCKMAVLRFAAEGFLVSFCAWLGTAGIIAYNFRIVSPVTVIVNILVAPLATLITLCGFSLILSGVLCPPLAGPFSAAASVLVTLLLSINSFAVKVPYAYFYL
jgi:competence protein ComEC